MENFFYHFYLYFIETLRATDSLFLSVADFLWPTLFLGIFCCFFGFKMYRIIFSVFSFMGLAILICLLCQNWMGWGAVVATFTILGGILSFASFFWRKIGAVGISALWGFVLGQLFISDPWLATIVAIVFGAVALFRTFDVIVLSSSLVGGVILGFFGTEFVAQSFFAGIDLLTVQWIATLVLSVLGCLTQYLTNRKQKLIPRKLISFRQDEDAMPEQAATRTEVKM